MTVPAIQTPTKSPRTRLIGFVAMGVCAIGYVGGDWRCWRARSIRST